MTISPSVICSPPLLTAVHHERVLRSCGLRESANRSRPQRNGCFRKNREGPGGFCSLQVLVASPSPGDLPLRLPLRLGRKYVFLVPCSLERKPGSASYGKNYRPSWRTTRRSSRPVWRTRRGGTRDRRSGAQ